MQRTSAICLSLALMLSISLMSDRIDFQVKATETPIHKYKIENCIGKIENTSEPTVFNEISLITKEKVSDMKIKSIYTPPPKEISKKVYNYTDDDLFCMAAGIYNEHGGNNATDIQRILDGNVIINRVKSGKFANTIRGVLESEGQYAGFENGVKFPSRAKNACEQEAVKMAYAIAKRVLEGETLCPSNVVYQSEYRHLGKLWKQIGNTYYSTM